MPRPATWPCLLEIAGRTLGGILVETPGDIGSSEGDRVAERVRVREISSHENNRLLRIRRTEHNVDTDELIRLLRETVLRPECLD
jgi:hypothetical protein